MDITSYKEAVRRGENIPFLLSKKKMIFGTIMFTIFAFICLCMLFTGIDFLGKMFCFAFFLLLGFLGLLYLKPLLRHQMPPVMFINKDCLEIFLNPLNENSPFISILWGDILDIYIEVVKGGKGHKTYYLALNCTDSAILNILTQIKQSPFLSIRVCSVRNNIVMLNISSFIDISLSDLLSLLKGIHKDLTAEQQ